MTGLADTFSSPLMQRALLEAVVAGLVGGVVGVHVVLRRLSFFTVALTHATFPGVVIAALLGVSLFVGATAFGVVVVVVLALLGRRRGLDSSTSTGVVLAGGFALGVVLISSQPGFTKDLTGYLVGSILTVSVSDIVTSAAVAAFVLAVVLMLHKEFVLVSFDRQAAEAAGYPVFALDLILLLLVELTVITSIPAMGTILSIALIVAPAAAARLWTERVVTAMALAAGIGIGGSVLGLTMSRAFDVAAGASIAVVLSSVFAVSWVASPRHGLLSRSRSRTRPASVVGHDATRVSVAGGSTVEA